MEKKNSVGKYILIFEPKYVSYQYALYLNSDGTSEVAKINRYTDTFYSSKKKIKKNSLSDIDKITASFSDLGSLFKSLVDPSIFKYQSINLHTMFIGYKQNEYMYKFNYIINNPELLSKLKFVIGSKIYDTGGINSMIDLIMTSENNGFLNFVTKEKRGGATNLSTATINLANLCRVCGYSMDSSCERYEVRKKLEDKLTSYKEYREMFLLQKRYQDYLKEEKERLEKIREEASASISGKQPAVFPGPYTEGEQLSFFSDKPKCKSIGNK